MQEHSATYKLHKHKHKLTIKTQRGLIWRRITCYTGSHNYGTPGYERNMMSMERIRGKEAWNNISNAYKKLPHFKNISPARVFLLGLYFCPALSMAGYFSCLLFCVIELSIYLSMAPTVVEFPKKCSLWVAFKLPQPTLNLTQRQQANIFTTWPAKNVLLELPAR